MDLRTVLLRDVSKHRKRSSLEEGTEGTESDSCSDRAVTTAGASPALSHTVPSPDSGSGDEADWASNFQIVEYAVRNTFIDGFAGSDEEPETSMPVGRSRTRALTDGDLEYGSCSNRFDDWDDVHRMCASKSICTGALSEAETVALPSPAQPDVDQHQSTIDVDECRVSFQFVPAPDGSMEYLQQGIASPYGVEPLSWTPSEQAAFSASDVSYMSQTQFVECAEVFHPSGAGGGAPHTSPYVSAMQPQQHDGMNGLVMMWLPDASGTWGYDQCWAAVSAAPPSMSQEFLGGESQPAQQLDMAVEGRSKAAAFRTPQALESFNTHADIEQPTTVMIRNFPNDYTRDMLLELMDGEGFRGTYDFVYMPMDFHRRAGLGYAFVNLVTHEDATRLRQHFQGFSDWALQSQKVCEVAWGEPLQGLAAHVERFRNSPVMHEDVPDEYKPALFESGVRRPFPIPTKRLRPPRLKHRPSAEKGRH